MRSTVRLATVLTVAAFVFAACSSGGPDEPGELGATTNATTTTTVGEGGAGIDACGLLTEDDVATLVGAGAQPESGEGTGIANTATCSWRATNVPPDGDAKIITLTVGEASEYEEIKAGQPEAEDVPALGPQAFSVVASTGPIVVATDGERTFQIQFLGGTDADVGELETLLATAISNLESPEPVNNPNE